MRHFFSPLRYPGGKSCIYSFISSLFHENNLIGVNYAEPYAGGAGLALKLLFNEFVEKIYINDYDIGIYSFWNEILTNADSFCNWINDVDINIENWMYYKNILSNKFNVDKSDLSKAVFFLNRTNISGVLKGGPIGGLLQQGKYKIDVRFNRDDLIKKIQRISALNNRIILSNQDGIEFIKRIDRSNEDTLIYLDPPYYQKGSNLYMNFYSDKDHLALAKFLDKIKSLWLASYDNHKFILDIYKEKRKILYKLSQNTSNRIGDEIMIFSEEIYFEKSINFLNNPIILPL